MERRSTTMAEPETPEIKDTDIVFECPHCGKSLAIDYRGAGLTIPCTDCGKGVEVPIPEGMELEDLDFEAEDRPGMILRLREALSMARTQILRLEGQVEELREQRDRLEKDGLENKLRLQAVQAQIGTIRSAVERITMALAAISTAARPPE